LCFSAPVNSKSDADAWNPRVKAVLIGIVDREQRKITGYEASDQGALFDRRKEEREMRGSGEAEEEQGEQEQEEQEEQEQNKNKNKNKNKN
jgi:hypothetical protein